MEADAQLATHALLLQVNDEQADPEVGHQHERAAMHRQSVDLPHEVPGIPLVQAELPPRLVEDNLPEERALCVPEQQIVRDVDRATAGDFAACRRRKTYDWCWVAAPGVECLATVGGEGQEVAEGGASKSVFLVGLLVAVSHPIRCGALAVQPSQQEPRAVGLAHKHDAVDGDSNAVAKHGLELAITLLRERGAVPCTPGPDAMLGRPREQLRGSPLAIVAQ